MKAISMFFHEKHNIYKSLGDTLTLVYIVDNGIDAPIFSKRIYIYIHVVWSLTPTTDYAKLRIGINGPTFPRVKRCVFIQLQHS